MSVETSKPVELQSSSPTFIPLQKFVSDIEVMSRGTTTKQELYDYLVQHQISPDELRPYEHWLKERHTRNLIFRNQNVEIMVLCWNVGNVTPLHTHNGQLGWMSMVRGRLMVENYRVVRCNRPENQQVVGIDCLAGATEIEMEKLSTEHCIPGGPINTVDKTQTIHRILNPAEWNEPAVSLHIYSRPIDSCVVFDLENQRCSRRDLSYDN
ncbi:MAG: cysteine dioxygenase family protein [Thermoanaerobaculia bacterium]